MNEQEFKEFKNKNNEPLMDGEQNSSQVKKYFDKFRENLESKRMVRNIQVNGVYLPKDIFSNHSGFGGGVEVWDRYHIGDTKIAQYMSPRRLTSSYKLRDSIHYNLCGELAVINALGIGIEYGFVKFAEMAGGTEILNTNMTTSGYVLANLISKIDGGKYSVPEIPRNSFGIHNPVTMYKMTWNKDIIISLVNIDTYKYGNLRDINVSRHSVAHWVWVQKVFEYDGNSFVRVYNPYMNREEIYSWEIFESAYRQTRGNTSKWLSVYAKKMSNL